MTPEWQPHVRPELIRAIEQAAQYLEKPGLAPDRTEFYRGVIAACRNILALEAVKQEKKETLL